MLQIASRLENVESKIGGKGPLSELPNGLRDNAPELQALIQKENMGLVWADCRSESSKQCFGGQEGSC